jgi:predicted Zn-dependent peptidase
VKAIFGDLKKEVFAAPQFEKASFLEKNVELEQEMDVSQAYLIIGMTGPDYNHPDQFAIDVLTEILGQGVNPLLNSVLRGRRDLVQTISMNYNSLKYGGVILLIFTLDPKNLSFAKSAAVDFLRKTRNENYSKEDFFGENQIYAFDYLGSAKNQIKFDLQLSQEISLSVAVSLARYMLLDDNIIKGSYLENIKKLSSSDLRKVAGQYFSRGKYVIVSIIPKKKK